MDAINVSEEEMRSMIDAAGLSHDGVVDWQELQTLYTAAATKISGSVEEALAAAAKQSGYDQDKCAARKR